jgi:hypothetical protein
MKTRTATSAVLYCNSSACKEKTQPKNQSIYFPLFFPETDGEKIDYFLSFFFLCHLARYWGLLFAIFFNDCLFEFIEKLDTINAALVVRINSNRARHGEQLVIVLDCRFQAFLYDRNCSLLDLYQFGGCGDDRSGTFESRNVHRRLFFVTGTTVSPGEDCIGDHYIEVIHEIVKDFQGIELQESVVA